MTTISNQSAINAQLLNSAVMTSAASSKAAAAAAETVAASGAHTAPAAAPSATPSADALAAATAAAANSGSYSFSTVATNALTVLNAGSKSLGTTPTIYKTAAQWSQIFGGMDRRSLYAVASNEGGQFSTLEQQAAGSMMSSQESQAFGSAPGSSGVGAANFQSEITFLKNVSPEEKQSVGWAMSMSAAQTSYSEFVQNAGQRAAQTGSYANPLVSAIMTAMKSSPNSPSTDRSVGPQSTLAEILNQPWAKGFESQIQEAYAATAPQGNLLDVSA